MKLLALLAFGLLPVLAMTAQTEPADTVKILDNADQVVITKNGNNTIVKAVIRNAENDTSMKLYTYSVTVEENTDSAREEFSESVFLSHPLFTGKQKKQSSTSAEGKFKPRRNLTALRNIYWGWDFAYDGKAGLRNSFEVGVAEIVSVEWQPWRNGPDFRFGAGFGMKQFLTADNFVFGKEGDRLAILPVTTDATDVKSRWEVLTFHFPLMVSQKIYRNFGIAFGTLLNLNTYSTACTQMKIDGIRYKETFKGLQQRLFTAELIGILGFRDFIGVYAKWSPMPLMRTYYGPEFKTWTLGVSVNF